MLEVDDTLAAAAPRPPPRKRKRRARLRSVDGDSSADYTVTWATEQSLFAEDQHEVLMSIMLSNDPDSTALVQAATFSLIVGAGAVGSGAGR